MGKRELKSQIEGINVWKKGAQRAPHKPLLLLYALARNGQRHGCQAYTGCSKGGIGTLVK